jgi:hypothetical protein
MTAVERDKSANGIKDIDYAGLIGSGITHRMAKDHVDALTIGPAEHAGREHSRQ